jgi:hypothetical protein
VKNHLGDFENAYRLWRGIDRLLDQSQLSRPVSRVDVFVPVPDAAMTKRMFSLDDLGFDTEVHSPHEFVDVLFLVIV